VDSGPATSRKTTPRPQARRDGTVVCSFSLPCSECSDMNDVRLASRSTLRAPAPPRGALSPLGVKLLAATGAGDEEAMAIAGDGRTEVRLVKAERGQGA